jgi:two-component system cell cycle sensor histidine kinase/response regulator CckA
MPTSYRILVIDDTATIHEDFRKILTSTTKSVRHEEHDLESAVFGATASTPARSTFTVDSAMQGERGFALLLDAKTEDRPYALAFVDMRMPPGWDGITTIRHLWAADPLLQVVICTAYSDTSWEQTINALGDSDSLLILKKPFDNIEVLQLAHALTKKWAIARQHDRQLARRDHAILQRTTELHAAEERFSLAFNASPLPQVIQDLDTGRIIEINSAHEKFTGLPRNELLGSAAGCFGRGGDSSDWQPVIETLRAGLTVDEWEFTHRPEGQAPREMRCSARPVTIKQRPYAVWVFRDVTDQLQLEQQFRQAQKMEAVGQLAAGVAHDFNNLLTVILSYTSFVLDDTTIADEHRSGLGQVRAAAQRAASLTRQLLVFSRLQITKPESLDVGATLGSLREMLARLVPERIKLEWHCSDPLPFVVADAANLEQIVMNLIVNARDAISSSGTIRLSLDAVTLTSADATRHPGARAGRFLRLAVSDSGKGMEPAVLARIFEPFFTTKGVGEGTGLGLSTVYGMVHQHGGWLEVASAPSRGTTFEIFFPALSTEASILAAAASESPFELPQGRGESVLLVEDESLLRDTASHMLTRAGYRVTSAADGPRALQAWSTAPAPFDLLLTDIVMPNGISGIELAAALRVRHTALKVILSTGYSDELLRAGAKTLRETHLLLKPYANGALLAIVRKALDGSDPSLRLPPTETPQPLPAAG